MKKFSVLPVAPLVRMLAIVLAFGFILAGCASSAAASSEISFPGTNWAWKNSSGSQSREISFEGSTFSYYANGELEAAGTGDYWLEGNKLWIKTTWDRAEGSVNYLEYWRIKNDTIRDISHNPPWVYRQKYTQQ